MLFTPSLRAQRSHPVVFATRAITAAMLLLLTACHHDLSEQDISVQGIVPPLSLAMTDVTTNQQVTAQSFAGKTVLLYFGYTNCPDVCPATLYNLDKILRKLGPAASQIEVLFVTVDPDRDTPATLAQYTALFGPNIHGLRGTPDELYALARRYRVVFSVKKPTATTPYAVTHSAAIYVFNAQAQAQFLIAGLDTDAPDLPGITADLADTLTHHAPITPLIWLENLFSTA